MIDIKMIGLVLADTHNMLNDLSIKGGNNARIVVYAQDNLKRIVADINKELGEHPELYKQEPVEVPFLSEPSREDNPNDNTASIK